MATQTAQRSRSEEGLDLEAKLVLANSNPGVLDTFFFFVYFENVIFFHLIAISTRNEKKLYDFRDSSVFYIDRNRNGSESLCR